MVCRERVQVTLECWFKSQLSRRGASASRLVNCGGRVVWGGTAPLTTNT